MRSAAFALGVWFGSLSLLAAPAVADDKPVADQPDANHLPRLKSTRHSLATLEAEPPLAPEVNAGVIERAKLRAELAGGIGNFLRQVRTEPAFLRGRFVGWRLLDLFPRRPDVHVLVLRPGDTVLRVNGHSVEHPEEFKLVWDAMQTATELVIDIERAGRPSKLRYTIAN